VAAGSRQTSSSEATNPREEPSQASNTSKDELWGREIYMSSDSIDTDELEAEMKLSIMASKTIIASTPQCCQS